MDKKIRVVVVDKHPMFRDGVILALNSQPDAEVVAQGASAQDAIRIVEEIKPDVLVLDMGILNKSMDAIEAILQQDPTIGILFFAVVIDE